VNTLLLLACVALASVCGCSSRGASQGGPAAAHVGAPSLAVDASVLRQDSAPTPIRYELPGRITLPASYRLVIVDGHLTLVREADTQALEPAPTSMRIVSGEISRGELAYQPALLPEELAAEVAANRESAGRMDNALESVMARSRELSDQARAAQAEAERLAQLLASAEARIRELEPARKPAVPRTETDRAEPEDTR
jgi:hypothetical protein